MEKILLLLLIISTSSSYAEVLYRPNFTYPTQAINSYNWMVNYNNATLSISSDKTTSKFLSKTRIRKYTTLKMRNFIKQYKIINPEKYNDKKNQSIVGYDYNFISLNVELHKYNDKLNIYYGIISFDVTSSINNNNIEEEKYLIALSLAGSEAQILNVIKSNIDVIIEAFAEDVYKLEDLINTKKLSKK